MESQSTDLDQIITELDRLLSEGYIKQLDYIHQYNIKSKEEGFDLNKFLEEKQNELNGWYGKVVILLHSKFTEKYHLFHFMKQKRTAMSIPEIPRELSNIIITFESHLFALEDIILRLAERRNLAIRQEIAEKEYQTDIIYKITYSEHTREIKLNNMLLARLQFDSKNVNFFEYVYARPNQQLAMKDIEEDTATTLAANIHDILRDLGFKGNIRQVFFPIATKSKVMFMNPITKQYAIKNDLPTIKLSKDNETEREEKS